MSTTPGSKHQTRVSTSHYGWPMAFCDCGWNGSERRSDDQAARDARYHVWRRSFIDGQAQEAPR